MADLPIGAVEVPDLPAGAIPIDDAPPPEGVPGPVGRSVPPGMIQAAQDKINENRERGRRKVDELTSILGGQFDPYATFDESYISQFDIARSESLTDKMKKFKVAFPDGDMKAVPTSDGKILVGRVNKDSLYQELPFTPEVLASIFSPGTALGIAGSFLGPVGTFAGTAAGEYVDTQIEQARGYGEDEPGIMGSAFRGGIAAGIDAASRGVGRMIYGPALTPYAREAMHASMAASKELGLEPLAVGQLSGPFGRGIFRQVGATSPRIEAKVTAEERSLLESFRELADDIPTDLPEILGDVVKAQQKELQSLITLPSLSRVEAGDALQAGIKTYEKASKLHVGMLYDNAISLSDDVTFNLRPAKETAQNIQTGVLARGEVDPIEVSGGLTAELKSVVDDVLALDENMAKFSAEGKAWTGFEQLKALRTRLFDLKQSDDGATRRGAHQLWESLTDVMDNPISGDPVFVHAYQKASAANWVREDTLEKSFIAQALRSDTPDALARKYMTPNNAKALATIHDLVPKETWEQFRTGFMVDLMNSPSAKSAMTKMDNFAAIDSDGLSLLMSPSEQRAMWDFLQRKVQFEASPVRAILDQQLTLGEQAAAIAKKGSAGELADAIAKSGGANSPFATAAKAGIYKDILDSARKVNEQGIEVLDSGKLVQAIAEWRKGDRLSALFGPDDWRRIELFQKYGAVASETADVGGAMMAGGLRQEAIAAPIQTLYGEGRRVAVKVIRPLLQNNITAAILSRPAAYSRIAMSQTGRLPIEKAGLALGMLEAELMREQSAR